MGVTINNESTTNQQQQNHRLKLIKTFNLKYYISFLTKAKWPQILDGVGKEFLCLNKLPLKKISKTFVLIRVFILI